MLRAYHFGGGGLFLMIIIQECSDKRQCELLTSLPLNHIIIIIESCEYFFQTVCVTNDRWIVFHFSVSVLASRHASRALNAHISAQIMQKWSRRRSIKALSLRSSLEFRSQSMKSLSLHIPYHHGSCTVMPVRYPPQTRYFNSSPASPCLIFSLGCPQGL